MPRLSSTQPSVAPLERRVLAQFRTGVEMQAGELESGLHVSRATLNRTLRALVDAGHLHRVGGGRSVRYRRA